MVWGRIRLWFILLLIVLLGGGGEESLIYQHQGTSTILLKVISLKAMCFTRARGIRVVKGDSANVGLGC